MMTEPGQDAMPVCRLRVARQWTQIDLALRARVSLSTVRLAERGVATTRTLGRLARALSVPIEDVRPRATEPG